MYRHLAILTPFIHRMEVSWRGKAYAAYVTCLNVFVSSANFNRELTTDDSMLFIKITNNIGPSIDPSGTPLITFCQYVAHQYSRVGRMFEFQNKSFDY